MTKIDFDVKRVNLGHILTIFTILLTVTAFWFNIGERWAKAEARMSVMENNINWLVKIVAEDKKLTPPPSSK